MQGRKKNTQAKTINNDNKFPDQSAYELYTNGVRHGVFTYKDDNNNSNCRQLRLIVDSDRRVVDILNF